MKDVTKSCKNVHLILVITSITILLFALSKPDKHNVYSLACDEIDSVKKAFDKLENDEEEILRKYYEKSELFKVMSSKFKNFNSSVVKVNKIDIPIISEMPIKYICNAIGSRHQTLDVMLMDLNEFSSIDLFSIPKEEAESIINLNYKALSVFSSFTSVNITSANGHMGKGNDGNEQYLLTIQVSGYIGDKKETIIQNLRMKATLHQRLAGIKVGIFDKILSDYGLIKVEGNTSESLPNINRVLEEIKDLSLTEAKAKLNRKSNDLGNSIEYLKILGFKIDPKLAVFGGPIFLISTMLLLLAHVSHVLSLSTGNTGKSLLDVAWIALYPSKLGYTITLTSIIVLPIVSTSWIVAVFSPEKQFFILTVYVLFEFLIGKLISNNIYKLRALASSQLFPDGPKTPARA